MQTAVSPDPGQLGKISSWRDYSGFKKVIRLLLYQKCDFNKSVLKQGMTNAIANDSFVNAFSIVVGELVPANDPFFRSLVRWLMTVFFRKEKLMTVFLEKKKKVFSKKNRRQQANE